ncbi:hypothetical protein Tco_1059197, partial [Tanacetum coccineum]
FWSITRYTIFTSIGYGVSNFLIQYNVFIQKTDTAYTDQLNTTYHSSDTVTENNNDKGNQGRFEKLESLKTSDDSFTCNTSLEFFYKEFNRMNRMDDDLFTYEVGIPGLANIPCDLKEEDDSEKHVTRGSDANMKYDPSNIYWTRGDDEVELTDEESSNSNDENLIDENEVAEIFRIETNAFDFETPTCKAFKEFNYLFQIDPDILTKG